MKNEYEKMLAGEWYDANYSEELLNLRTEAQDLCFEYNQLRPSAHAEKKKILEKYLKKFRKD